jgi:hypothetical protein
MAGMVLGGAYEMAVGSSQKIVSQVEAVGKATDPEYG